MQWRNKKRTMITEIRARNSLEDDLDEHGQHCQDQHCHTDESFEATRLLPRSGNSSDDETVTTSNAAKAISSPRNNTKRPRGSAITGKFSRRQLFAWFGLLGVVLLQAIQVYYLDLQHQITNTFQQFDVDYSSPVHKRLQNFRSPRHHQHQQHLIDQQKFMVALSNNQTIHSGISTSSPSTTVLCKWNQYGCQDWITAQASSHFASTKDNTHDQNQKPTGLVVTLVLTPDDPAYLNTTRSLVCRAIPSQLHYLVGPQQWDFLLIISGESFHAQLSTHYLTECLQLRPPLPSSEPEDEQQRQQHTWTNLDGTNLTTTKYLTQWNTTFYIAHTHIAWPELIQQNPSILNKTIKPPLCNAPKSYIQGTRWYSNELLHLAILQNYDYFIKLDTDIYFIKSPKLDLLHDLQQRNALLGHTAKTPPNSGLQCAKGIRAAIQDFLKARPKKSTTTTGSFYPAWRHDYCSSDRWEIQQDRDLFYTNFMMGRVDFWTQPLLRDLTQFLSNHPRGFFEYRWTDQIFWHNAMGLLLDGANGFLDYTADYTELRCSTETNCWMAVFSTLLYGSNSYHRCDNDGAFLHVKDPRYQWNQDVPLTYPQLWRSNTTIWNTTYRHECPIKTERRKKEVLELMRKKPGDPTTDKKLPKLNKPKGRKQGNIG